MVATCYLDLHDISPSQFEANFHGSVQEFGILSVELSKYSGGIEGLLFSFGFCKLGSLGMRHVDLRFQG